MFRFKLTQDYYYTEHYRELYDNEKPLQLILFWAQNGLLKRRKLCLLDHDPEEEERNVYENLDQGELDYILASVNR